MLLEEEVRIILDRSARNLITMPEEVFKIAEDWISMRTFLKNELEELKFKAKFESECG